MNLSKKKIHDLVVKLYGQFHLDLLDFDVEKETISGCIMIHSRRGNLEWCVIKPEDRFILGQFEPEDVPKKGRTGCYDGGVRALNGILYTAVQRIKENPYLFCDFSDKEGKV